MVAPNDPETVFWQRTDKRGPDDCWPWTGGTTTFGYGAVWIRGKLRKATHIALELDGRPRPNKALALHSCDNPICVNPAHLRWGGHQENTSDKMTRGRWRTGENPNFKRSPKLVRATLEATESNRALAKRLGVSAPTVQRIRADHGIKRPIGRSTSMMDRIWNLMSAMAPIGEVFEVNQSAIARELGLASSNVNVGIRRLSERGRLGRVGKLYRLLR